MFKNKILSLDFVYSDYDYLVYQIRYDNTVVIEHRLVRWRD